MAKVHLKFGQSVLKTYDLPEYTSLKVGRMPDNEIHIDNLAVSGHHATIRWDTDHFVIEDNHSLNGVWIQGKRIEKSRLTVFPSRRRGSPTREIVLGDSDVSQGST